MFLRSLPGTSVNLSEGFHRVERDADVLWRIRDECKRRKEIETLANPPAGHNPFWGWTIIQNLVPRVAACAATLGYRLSPVGAENRAYLHALRFVR